MVGREWGFCHGAAELVIGMTLLSELGRAVERACGTRRFAGATLAARCAMEIVLEGRVARARGRERRVGAVRRGVRAVGDVWTGDSGDGDVRGGRRSA